MENCLPASGEHGARAPFHSEAAGQNNTRQSLEEHAAFVVKNRECLEDLTVACSTEMPISTDQRTSQERHHYRDTATNHWHTSLKCLYSGKHSRRNKPDKTVIKQCYSCRAVVMLGSQRCGTKKVESSTLF